MKQDNFSTFDLVKILGINRNTLQSLIDGQYLTPDIQKATRKGERSLFSKEGVYSAGLYLSLIRSGCSRDQARKLLKGEEAEISWENVGEEEGKIQYLCKHSYKRNDPNLLGMVKWKVSADTPRKEMEKDETARLIINLSAIKTEIDEAVRNLR